MKILIPQYVRKHSIILEYFQSLLTQLFVENYENIKKNIENLMIMIKSI